MVDSVDLSAKALHLQLHEATEAPGLRFECAESIVGVGNRAGLALGAVGARFYTMETVCENSYRRGGGRPVAMTEVGVEEGWGRWREGDRGSGYGHRQSYGDGGSDRKEHPVWSGKLKGRFACP